MALALAGGWGQDADDDVRAVAASALLPLAPALTASGQRDALSQLHGHLWEILLDSDELSPATGERCLPAACCGEGLVKASRRSS